MVAGVNWNKRTKGNASYQCRPCAKRYKTAWDAQRRGDLPPQKPKRVALHPQLVRIRKERAAAYALKDKAETAMLDGFVYLIISYLHPGSVKIGKSRDPVSRLTSANTWCPWRNFEILAYEHFADYHATEKQIHRTLSACRVAGTEWFNVSAEQALRVLDIARREALCGPTQ